LEAKISPGKAHQCPDAPELVEVVATKPVEHPNISPPQLNMFHQEAPGEQVVTSSIGNLDINAFSG
jgi:hypothetical protein